MRRKQERKKYSWQDIKAFGKPASFLSGILRVGGYKAGVGAIKGLCTPFELHSGKAKFEREKAFFYGHLGDLAETFGANFFKFDDLTKFKDKDFRKDCSVLLPLCERNSYNSYNLGYMEISFSGLKQRRLGKNRIELADFLFEDAKEQFDRLVNKLARVSVKKDGEASFKKILISSFTNLPRRYYERALSEGMFYQNS